MATSTPSAGKLLPGLHDVQASQLALFKRASVAMALDIDGVLRAVPADQPRYVYGGGANLCKQASIAAPHGDYGAAVGIKIAGANLQRLVPGEVITLSAIVRQDADAAAAGGNATLFLWAADGDGYWTTQVNASTTSTSGEFLQMTLALPASAASMVSVGIGVYHLGANATWLGEVRADNVMLNRGAAALAFEPYARRLLIEAAATNAAAHSNTFTAGWSTDLLATLTPGAAAGPDGVAGSATKLSRGSNVYMYTGHGGEPAGTNTVSIFIKRDDGGSVLRFGVFGPGAGSGYSGYADFDLTVGTASIGLGAAEIESLADGWFRLAVTASDGQTPRLTELVMLDTTVPGTGMLIYGYMASPGLSSYVPSSGAPATRAADVAVLWQAEAVQAEPAAQPMDAALRWDAATGQFDLVIDAEAADLQAEDTLLTAVVLSLMCDATAQADEVPAGIDRRGWWADAYSDDAADSYGSRLWLLAREKQLPATIARARAYIQQALQWLVDDGLATGVDAVVFAPRMGWLTAQVQIALDGESRRYRFEWSDARQAWRLQGDA